VVHAGQQIRRCKQLAGMGADDSGALFARAGSAALCGAAGHHTPGAYLIPLSRNLATTACRNAAYSNQGPFLCNGGCRSGAGYSRIQHCSACAVDLHISQEVA